MPSDFKDLLQEASGGLPNVFNFIIYDTLSYNDLENFLDNVNLYLEMNNDLLNLIISVKENFKMFGIKKYLALLGKSAYTLDEELLDQTERGVKSLCYFSNRLHLPL